MGPPGYQLYKSFHTSWSDEFVLVSMGDLQEPIHGGTLVPYVWPYFLVIYLIFTYIGLIIIGLIYGRYLHFRILKFPLIVFMVPSLSMSSNALVLWVFRCFQILTHLHLFGCWDSRFFFVDPWNCQSHEPSESPVVTSGRPFWPMSTLQHGQPWIDKPKKANPGCVPQLSPPKLKACKSTPRFFSQFKFTNVNCI